MSSKSYKDTVDMDIDMDMDIYGHGDMGMWGHGHGREQLRASLYQNNTRSFFGVFISVTVLRTDGLILS